MEHYQISNYFFNFHNNCSLGILRGRLDFIYYVLHHVVIHVLNWSSDNYFIILSSLLQISVCEISALSNMRSLDTFQTLLYVAKFWSRWYLNTCWTSLVSMTFTLFKPRHRLTMITTTIWHKIGLGNLNCFIPLYILLFNLEIQFILNLCF